MDVWAAGSQALQCAIPQVAAHAQIELLQLRQAAQRRGQAAVGEGDAARRGAALTQRQVGEAPAGCRHQVLQGAVGERDARQVEALQAGQAAQRRRARPRQRLVTPKLQAPHVRARLQRQSTKPAAAS